MLGPGAGVGRGACGGVAESGVTLAPGAANCAPPHQDLGTSVCIVSWNLGKVGFKSNNSLHIIFYISLF